MESSSRLKLSVSLSAHFSDFSLVFCRQVKRSVTALLPLLAQYNKLDFSRKYLKRTLKYLYGSCQTRYVLLCKVSPFREVGACLMGWSQDENAHKCPNYGFAYSFGEADASPLSHTGNVFQ